VIWTDLVISRLLAMSQTNSPFNREHTTSYSPLSETMRLCYTIFVHSKLFVKSDKCGTINYVLPRCKYNLFKGSCITWCLSRDLMP